MKKIIILAVVVLAGVAIVLVSRGMFGSGTSEDLASQDAADVVVMTLEEIADAEAVKAAVQSNPAPARYTNDKFGFSFQKPEGYTVGALPGEAGGQTLIIQRSSASQSASISGAQEGFQIVITPLDEPMTLTPELIKSDLPGTTVVGPLAINLDSKGKGMMFSSNNENFGGKSYEIWFTTTRMNTDKDTQINTDGVGYLYQITSYGSFADQLKNIIGTWKFN